MHFSTTVFLNGAFVREEDAVVSVLDRGFLYGDGLFESVRIHRGAPFRWADHFQRLEQGAQMLGIPLPYSTDDLRGHTGQLVERNQMPEALLRMTLSRGVGARGYSPKGADRPTFVMTLHAAPDAHGGTLPLWRVRTASMRLPAGEALARFKTCNKLPQILARAEAEAAGDDEALLLNTEGEIVEASSGNLFWIENEVICTPPLNSGILAGVTRKAVLEMCGILGLKTREAGIAPAELRQADGIFVSLSSWGIVEVVAVDGEAVGRSAIVVRLREAYLAEMEHSQ